MTTILLARHGESDWNASNRFQGLSDRPLTEWGRRQARELAAALDSTHLDAVYTSPLRRSRETAEIVAARQGLTPQLVPELTEVDVGSWAGLVRKEVESRFPDAFGRWQAGGEGWEDGESYEAMAERVLAAVRRIAAAHPGGHVLVVSHGGPIHALHAAADGMTVREYRRLGRVQPNARLSRLAVEGDAIARLD